MRKIVLFVVIIGVIVGGFQITKGQTVTEEKLKEEKAVTSGQESLQPRGELKRKDLKTIITCKSTKLNQREAKLIHDLKAAKEAGDERAVKIIEKKLGWTKSLSSKFKNTSLPPQRVIRENLTNGGEKWGEDILVSVPTWSSIKPAIASTSDGILFVVDEDADANYLDIYMSTDNGNTWNYYFSIYGGDNDPVNPSIVVGEGSEDWLFIAYELGNDLYVYRENLDTGDYDFILVVSNPVGVKHPQICVDSPEFSYWYVYITYAFGIIGAKQDYWEVRFQRSTDFGATWSSPITIATPAYGHLPRLDIDYGGDNLYIAYDNEYGPDDHDVYVRRSVDFGNTWDPAVALGYTTDDEYDPRVAATNGGSTVVVAYTRFYADSDSDIVLYYSTDNGNTWNYSFLPWTYDDEKTVDLVVSQSYGRIHAAFWRAWDVRYTWASYSDPSSWEPTILINEDNWVSGIYTRPTITVNPTQTLEEEACIAWTDYRFGIPYRVYFDAAYIPPPPPPTKHWTFMVYMDGDNNLESAAIDDFLEMASVGSNSDVNIVVQFDRIPGYDTSYGDWTICHRFYITPGMVPTEDNAISDWGDGSGGREVNMGDPQTLIDFVKWAMSNYPADNYVLVLWNHGNGWREAMEARGRFPLKAVCWDDTSAGDSLVMEEVGDALEIIENQSEQVDLVGFDACLMGMVEVAYEIKDHALVMVGSEETEPWDGWPYDTILADLVATPTMTPSDLACVIINRYGDSYGATSGTTLSAFDLTNISNLASAISSFADLMNSSPYKTEIATCRSGSQEYYYSSHIDLYHFADLVSTGVPDSAIQSAANNVKTEISNTIFCEFHGSQLPDSHGVAIYFPNCPDDSLDPDYNASVIDFASDTQWDEFLGWYCAPPELPDLIVTSITTDPTQPVEGEPVTIFVTVENQGPGDASGFYIDWYHHLDAPPSLYQVGDVFEYVPFLAAGATYTMTGTFTYSTAGDYNMYAQVDTEQTVIELDENNNVLGPQAVEVLPQCTTPPIIENISFDDCISELCVSDICVTAYDPCGGNLTYTWYTPDGGNIVGSGQCVQFDPPDTPPHICPYQVIVEVTSDASGLTTTETIPIYVKLAGDVNGDGVVNVLDKIIVRNNFGTSGEPGWIEADTNCDGVINVLDKIIVRDQFGQIGCSCSVY
ncbi:hypothetical protein DRQ11_05320 [candidate division KSB1 bacterium]|nr:MAG: hypothetical protein DRQ11_05320 [candidate division KSB1 bacterium]